MPNSCSPEEINPRPYLAGKDTNEVLVDFDSTDGVL